MQYQSSKQLQTALESFNYPHAAIIAEVFDTCQSCHTTPDTFWYCLASGAFKETYLPDKSASFVIKFVSTENDTKSEVALINRTKKKGLDFLFPKTFFIPLDVALPIEYLEGEVGWEYDAENNTYLQWCCTELVDAIVQEKIKVTCADCDPFEVRMKANETAYMKAPVKYSNGEILEHSKAYDCGIGSVTWMQTVIDRYEMMSLIDYWNL